MAEDLFACVLVLVTHIRTCVISITAGQCKNHKIVGRSVVVVVVRSLIPRQPVITCQPKRYDVH